MRVEEAASRRMERVELPMRSFPNLLQGRGGGDPPSPSQGGQNQFLWRPAALYRPHVQGIRRIDDDVAEPRRGQALVVDHVGPETAGRIGEAAHTQDAGNRDFGRMLRKFHRVAPGSVPVADGRELVDGSKSRLVEAGVELGSHAPDVDAGTLTSQRRNQVLVEIVGGYDSSLLEACFIEHPPSLDRQVREVSGVEAD